MITVASCQPDDPCAIFLLDQLSDTLAAITGDSGRASFDPRDMDQPQSLFVVARTDENTAVGCGAYRPLMSGIAELKRMYAAPGTTGVGAIILQHLEKAATQDGYTALWLETRRVNTRAVRFYERHGYTVIPNFGKYFGRCDAVCFAKQLGSGL
ncbi:MAG: GNAT family N-acetyltransferase [Rhizomicrobium sp.]